MVSALLAGCSLIGPRERTNSYEPIDGMSASALLAVLEEQRRQTHTLRAVAKVTLLVEGRGDSGPETVRTTQAVLVSAPASFRLDTLSAFGVSYSATSDGEELAILAPSEGSLYRGRATAATLRNATGVAAESGEIASLLLGQPPIGIPGTDALLLADDPAPKQGDEGYEVRLRIPLRTGGYSLIGFARASALSGRPVPVSFERFDTMGRSVLGARFEDHRLLGESLIPARITVTATGSSVSLLYRDIEINPLVESESFRIETPEGMRDVPLRPSCHPGQTPLQPQHVAGQCTSDRVLASDQGGWPASDCYRPRTSTYVKIAQSGRVLSRSSSTSPATEAPTQS